MSDNFIRHMVALAATAVCLLAYFSGYISAQNHWWWTAFGMAIIYGGVFKLVDK